MFCPQCGSKLADGARFCPQCGARVGADAGERPSENAPAERVEPDEGPAKHGSLASRLIEFRRTTLRAVPTFVIGLVAALLFAGTAYALYRVAVDVVIPMFQQEQPQQDEAEEATASPENPLQLARVLALDPKEIPAFLEDQGLERNNWFYYDNAPCWTGSFDDIADPLLSAGAVSPADLDEYRADARGDDVGLVLGQDAVAIGSEYPVSSEGSYLDETELLDGTRPDSMEIYHVPLSAPSDDVISSLCETMDMGAPDAVYRADEIDNGYLTAARYSYTVVTGSTTIDGEDFAWYVLWEETNYTESFAGRPAPLARIGCVRMDAAQAYVTDQTLYDADEWEAASATQRMGMFAQSLAQENLMDPSGTRVARMSLRTGEIELCEDRWEPTTWAPADDYEYADMVTRVDDADVVDFTVEEPSQTLGR